MKKIILSAVVTLLFTPLAASAQFGCTSDVHCVEPSAPQNLQSACAASGDGSVILSWSAGANATSYSVRVNIPGQTGFVYTGDTSQTSVSLRLAPNTQYAWWVHSNNASVPLGPYTMGPLFTCESRQNQPPAPTAPTLTFTATPSTISGGQSSTLTWSSTNAASCVSTGSAIPGTIGTQGSATVSPNISSVYTLTCSGYGGSVTKSVTVTVQEGGTASPAISITAPPSGTSVAAGSPITVSWTSTNAPTGSAVRFATCDRVVPGLPTTGSYTYTPTVNVCPNGSRNITITLEGNPSGPVYATAQTQINVTSAGGTSPSISITAPQNGANVAQGSSFTASWTSTNAPAGSSVTLALMPGCVGMSNLSTTGQTSVAVSSSCAVGAHDLKITLSSSNATILASQTISVTVTAPGTTQESITATPSSGPTPLYVSFSGKIRDTATVQTTRVDDGNGNSSITIVLGNCANGFCDYSANGLYMTGGTFTAKLLLNGTVLATTQVTATGPDMPPPLFQIGDRVRATAAVNVRATPSAAGNYLGTQQTGALGSVVDGPTVAYPYTWWKINWDTGADGWSVQDYLAKAVGTTPPPPGSDSITLLSPAANKNVSRGGLLYIAWTYPSITKGTSVDILLNDEIIGILPKNFHTYIYTIPGSQALGSARVKLNFRETRQGNLVASSQEIPITIVDSGAQPTVAITAPSNGSSVAKGAKQTVSWTTTNAPAGGEVLLLVNNEAVAKASASAGTLEWTVPMDVGNDYMYQLFLTDQQGVAVAQSGIPRINVTAGGTANVAGFGVGMRITPAIYGNGTVGAQIYSQPVEFVAGVPLANQLAPYKVGQQFNGTAGYITDGPRTTYIPNPTAPQYPQPVTWWYVDFATGVDGWVMMYASGGASIERFLFPYPVTSLLGSCTYKSQKIQEGNTQNDPNTSGGAAKYLCDNGTWIYSPEQVTDSYKPKIYTNVCDGIPNTSGTGRAFGCPPQQTGNPTLLSVSPRHGTGPLTVYTKSFAGYRNGKCAGYTLNWGDGTPSESIPERTCNGVTNRDIERSHTYTAAGNYTISFTNVNNFAHSAQVRVDSSPVSVVGNASQLANALSAIESLLVQIQKLLGQ